MGRRAPGNMAALAGSRTAMEAAAGPATAIRQAAGPAHPARLGHPARPAHPADPPRAATWPRPVAHKAATPGAAALTVVLTGTVAGQPPAARPAGPAAVVAARRAEAVAGAARPPTRVALVVGPASPAEPVPGMPRPPASRPLGDRRCRWRRLAPCCPAWRRRRRPRSWRVTTQPRRGWEGPPLAAIRPPSAALLNRRHRRPPWRRRPRRRPPRQRNRP